MPHKQGHGGGKETREGQREPVQEGREQRVHKYGTPKVTHEKEPDSARPECRCEWHQRRLDS